MNYAKKCFCTFDQGDKNPKTDTGIPCINYNYNTVCPRSLVHFDKTSRFLRMGNTSWIYFKILALIWQPRYIIKWWKWKLAGTIFSVWISSACLRSLSSFHSNPLYTHGHDFRDTLYIEERNDGRTIFCIK